MTLAHRKNQKPLKQKARVLIVDDHPVVRLGIRQRIELEPDLEVCADAATAREAVDLIETTQPDVIIVDIRLDDRSGLELIKDLTFRNVTAGILVVSSHDESVYAERCIRAGAHGYLNKAEAMDKIVEALRVVAAKGYYLSDAMTARTLKQALSGRAEASSPLATLSDRELQVYELLGKGLTVNQIAENLFLSPKTIETYRAHLKEKLNLANSQELARHAMRWMIEDT